MTCGAEKRLRPPRATLADVLRSHAPSREEWRGDEGRVIRDIVSCRTAERGGHVWKCDTCGHETPLYNSCRNRHCPSCQGFESAKWIDARQEDLLDVPYFHVVFTIPSALHGMFRRAPRVTYASLLATAAETLIDVCRSHLGATPGVVLVLHTWTQTMLFHPHVHCIVTGGGISLDGRRWIAARKKFFLPVRKLSLVFRAKLLQRLDEALNLTTTHRAQPLRHAAAQPWVVYAKAPIAGPRQVLRYLGRYTHRIAISNRRIQRVTRTHVTFSYTDRRHAGYRRTLSLPGPSFARRFLLHVLPRGFVRIRYYGLLANAHKRARLSVARTLIGSPAPPEPQPKLKADWREIFKTLVGRDPLQCTRCPTGTMRVIVVLDPVPHPPRPP